EEEEEDCGLALPVIYRPKQSCGRTTYSSYATADLCLHLIRQAIFRNQWEKAAELFTSYFQTLLSRNSDRRNASTETIWRIGNEILLNHPKSTSDDVNAFHEIMKNIGLKNYMFYSLEQVYHLLCNGDTDEAYRVLSVAESWRSGGHSMKQIQLQKLVQAHRAVLNYRSWMDRRSAMAQNEMDFSSQCSASQAMSSYYRQASVTFQDTVKFPGVWDLFVLNYVNILESSDEKEEAEKVLTDYANNDKNPPNPNAHVYLYEFLQRNGAPDEALLKVLRVLYSMTPSHKLMCKFSELLSNSESEEDQKLALRVLFDLLDFSGWKKSTETWGRLARLLKITFRQDHKAWVVEAWQPRKSWWPPYHFTTLCAKNDLQNCTKLAKKKALVSGMLLGPGCVYFTTLCGSEKYKTKTLCSMQKFIEKHNCED
ncbi:transcription by RNA polymerase I, partial [Pristimantis euphronides]